MKKIYQNPTIIIVRVETQKMIAESLGVGDEYNGEAVLSRSGSGNDDWDDDDY